MIDASEEGVLQRFYLDDLRVGQRFESATHTIDEAEIIEFASRFDPQSFHVDAEAAKRSMFGGLVASGWHTAAITMRLLVSGGLPIEGGMVGAGGEITWPDAVRPGDTLRVSSEVLTVTPSRSRPQRGTVTIRSETRTQRDTVVQLFVPRIIVMRRPDPAEA